MENLSNYTITEQAETVIDISIGEDFIKDLQAWDDEAPEAWVEMAMAYCRLAFVKGYALRRDEEQDGRVENGETFAINVAALGMSIPE